MDTRKSIRRLLLVPVALVAAACVLGSAQAQTADSRITIRYADLNLSTQSDAHRLYQRITEAARTMCGHQGRGVDAQLAWDSCVRGTVSDTVNTVNNPQLTAIEHGENPKSQVTALLTH